MFLLPNIINVSHLSKPSLPSLIPTQTNHPCILQYWYFVCLKLSRSYKGWMDLYSCTSPVPWDSLDKAFSSPTWIPLSCNKLWVFSSVIIRIPGLFLCFCIALHGNGVNVLFDPWMDLLREVPCRDWNITLNTNLLSSLISVRGVLYSNHISLRQE